MNLDIVIIGLNAEKTLSKCLESVLNVNYEKKDLHIFYVDGGSSDASVSIVKKYQEVSIIELNVIFPTAGLGRNKGWQAGNSPLVMFLDSDTILDPNFLSIAVPEILHPNIGAVKGLVKELDPKKSIYNWLADQEWNEKPGEAEVFGGMVLLRREVLEKIGGYNETLIAGEDPELSLRVRKAHWKIIQISQLMTRHDLAMTTFKQYFWRSYRSGYGYAAVYELHADHSSFWKKEVERIIRRGGGFFLLMILGFFSYGIISLIALCLFLHPRLFKVKAFSCEKSLTIKEAKLYAWHCSFVVIPQFLGATRFYLGKIFGCPLRNKVRKVNFCSPE